MDIWPRGVDGAFGLGWINVHQNGARPTSLSIAESSNETIGDYTPQRQSLAATLNTADKPFWTEALPQKKSFGEGCLGINPGIPLHSQIVTADFSCVN